MTFTITVSTGNGIMDTILKSITTIGGAYLIAICITLIIYGIYKLCGWLNAKRNKRKKLAKIFPLITAKRPDDNTTFDRFILNWNLDHKPFKLYQNGFYLLMDDEDTWKSFVFKTRKDLKLYRNWLWRTYIPEENMVDLKVLG